MVHISRVFRHTDEGVLGGKECQSFMWLLLILCLNVLNVSGVEQINLHRSLPESTVTSSCLPLALGLLFFQTPFYLCLFFRRKSTVRKGTLVDSAAFVIRMVRLYWYFQTDSFQTLFGKK